MPFVLAIAGLLFAFGFIAQEVVKGKTLAFDREMLALRNSADPRVPIGPTWLPEAARDLTSLGSIIVLVIITLAVVGYLFLAGRSAVAWLTLIAVFGGIVRSAEVCVRTRSTGCSESSRARLYHEFPERPCHPICDHLSDDRSYFGAEPTLINNKRLFLVAGGISDHADRREPDLPWCSLSD
jgi:hypothetical protein